MASAFGLPNLVASPLRKEGQPRCAISPPALSEAACTYSDLTFKDHCSPIEGSLFLQHSDETVIENDALEE